MEIEPSARAVPHSAFSVNATPRLCRRLRLAGCRSPVAGCRLPVAGCRLPVAGCRLSVAGCRLPVAGCRLPVAGCRLSVVGCREAIMLLATGNWQPSTLRLCPYAAQQLGPRAFHRHRRLPIRLAGFLGFTLVVEL